MGPAKVQEGPGCIAKCLCSPWGNLEPEVIILPLTFHQALRHEHWPRGAGPGSADEAAMTSARASSTEHLFSEASLPRRRATSQGGGCGGSTSLPRPPFLPMFTSAPAGSLLRYPNLDQGPSCCPHSTWAHLPTTRLVSSCPFSGFPSTGHEGTAPWSYFL